MRIPAILVVVLTLSGLPGSDVSADGEVPGFVEDYSVLFPLGVRVLDGRYNREPGGKAREQAIRDGLEWLAAHQSPSGAWTAEDLSWCRGKSMQIAPDGPGKAEHSGGVTGLALCAFFGAGYTDRGDHPFAGVVRRGLDWLVKSQDKSGSVGLRSGLHWIYSHAFGTLALLEAYAASGDARWLEAGRRALALSAAARNPYFAWRYGVRPGDNDTSATGCMSLSIYAAWKMNVAALAGGVLEPFEFSDEIYTGARAWLEKMTDPATGRVGYVTRGGRPARPQDLIEAFPGEKSESMTAIGVLLRQILPGGDAKRDGEMIDKGIGLMNAVRPNWDPEGGYTDFYYWYYGSMAMQYRGGKDAVEWSKAVAQALLPSQRKDTDVCAYKGSWDPKCAWGLDGGRTYSTAMAVLCLEAPVRAPRLPDPRTDVLDALKSSVGNVSNRVRLVQGAAIFDLKGAAGALRKVLGEDDVTLRCAAASALGRIQNGGDAIGPLGVALKDADAGVRVAAARALAKIASRSGGPAIEKALRGLIRRLEDPQAAVRAVVADALGLSEAQDAVAPLATALADKDLAVRVAAAGAHWRLAKDTALVKPHLTAGIQSEDARTRAEAVRHLEVLGPAAAWSRDLLVDARKDVDGVVRVRACRALWRVDPKSTNIREALLACLTDSSLEVRLLAVDQLGSMGGDGAFASAQLSAGLLKGPVAVRVASARALGSIGPAAKQAAAALWYSTNRGTRALRAAARAALDAMALAAPIATSALSAALADKDERIVQGAVWGLADVGAEAVPSLAGLLRGGQSQFVERVLAALEAIGPGSAPALETLVSLLTTSESERLRGLAATVIGSIGPQAASAAPALIRHLLDKSGTVRLSCVRALVAIAPQSSAAVSALADTLARDGAEHTMLRSVAAAGLGGLGDKAAPAVSSLVRALTSEDKGLRRVAVASLGKLGAVALDSVRRALAEESDVLREGAARAVARMGAAAAPAASDLVGMFERGKNSGKDLAVKALVAIGKPAVKPLLKGCKSRLDHVRYWCARSLGHLGSVAKSAKGRLKAMLKDKNGGVRDQARWALRQVSKR